MAFQRHSTQILNINASSDSLFAKWETAFHQRAHASNRCEQTGGIFRDLLPRSALIHLRVVFSFMPPLEGIFVDWGMALWFGCVPTELPLVPAAHRARKFSVVCFL